MKSARKNEARERLTPENDSHFGFYAFYRLAVAIFTAILQLASERGLPCFNCGLEAEFSVKKCKMTKVHNLSHHAQWLASWEELNRIQSLSEVFVGRNVRNSLLGPGSLIWLMLGILSCVLPALAFSQQSSDVQASETELPLDSHQMGTVSGTVLDSTGAVVPGARLILEPVDESTPQETTSGEYGQFSFSNVAPGSFEIKVTATGFAPQTSSGTLHSGQFYLSPAITLTPSRTATEIQVKVTPIEIAAAEVKAEEQQRIFGVLPNFYVTYAPDALPLTARQKMDLAWKSTIDPVNFALTGVSAGAEQLQDQFGGYGEGAQGYAKRFGASYADGATSTFIGSAILPILLKQDPRYFYKGTGTVRARILYALANSVICKGDNGHWQANYSAIAGGLASGGISNLYYPPKDRGATLVFENTFIGTGETAIVNVFQEFFMKRLTPHVPNYDAAASDAHPTKAIKASQ